jgi:hypothetical protein
MKFLTLRTFTAADLASADTKTADSTVIITAGKTYTGELLFFEKYVKVGVEPTEILTEFFRQMRMYHSKGVIERNRFEFLQKSARNLIARGWFGEPSEFRKLLNRIELVQHVTDNNERILHTVPTELKAHTLWFPSQVGWQDVKEQLLQYPAVEHDDILTVIAMLVEHSTAPRQSFTDMLKYDARDGYLGKSSAQTINEQLARRRYNIWTGTYGNAKTARGGG